MHLVLDILAQTGRTLWAHKLRSFLTMFGIAWGVGSLLLLVGLGEGFRTGNHKQLETYGKDIMFIFPGRIPAVEGQHTLGRRYYMTLQDYQDIRREAKHVRNISPVLTRQDIRAQSEFATTNGQVIGVVPVFNQIRYLPLEAGRWLNERDASERRHVAVLGHEMFRNLFTGRPALGATILLNGVRFEVVGVIQGVGRDENNATNSRLYIPFETMHMFFPLKDIQRSDVISFINYQPRVRGEHDLAKEEVHKIIAHNHNFDYRNREAFEEWDTIKNEEMVGKIFDAMDLFLGSVGLITLALGAIGIINIMLVSVTERTREIGLRKALGATHRSVMAQFFLEGAFLTLFSGGIGLAGAAGLMAWLHKLPSPPGFDPPTLVPSSAALAIGSLALAGIVAGLYPARKAALLTPVEALRKE